MYMLRRTICLSFSRLENETFLLIFKFQGCITLSYVFAHLVFFGSQINLKRVKLALNFPKINKIVK